MLHTQLSFLHHKYSIEQYSIERNQRIKKLNALAQRLAEGRQL